MAGHGASPITVSGFGLAPVISKVVSGVSIAIVTVIRSTSEKTHSLRHL